MAEVTSKPRRQSFKSHRPHKEVKFGSYILGSTLGEGEFGKVKLCFRKDGSQPSQVAIKFIRRDSIPKGSERESKVHREINALKRLSHPNIIKLEEVLQNDKYIGIVLEYASGGELFDYILQHRYLKDSLACRLFAQLVSGVYYMHSKGIVHRDLKLENLLLDKHKNIVITDFGFVNSFTVESELMKTSCGSPCYAAPELVISNEPYEARKVDVWSCGVILYAMLAGYLPFDDDPQNPDGDNIARLYQYITNTPLTFPEYIEPMPRDLLRRILISSPKKRMSLREVRGHQWLAPHAPFLSVTPTEWDKNNATNATSRVPQQRNLATKNDYRRYSLIDTAPTFQSHNTQSSAFFANPLPPQTSSSHAIAIPSSTSSTSIHEQLKFSPRGHTRTNSVQSYSSASLALQAVVDADEVRYHSNSPPLPSSSSAYGLDYVRRNSDAKKPGHIINGAIPRSTTHTGIQSLANPLKEQLINSTIEESPAKKPPQISDFAVPKIPFSSNNYHHPNPNFKLPGPTGGRKPRPTSYHPGLYSSHEQNKLDYQVSNAQPSAQFTRSESTASVTSLTNGKISKPSVEFVQAEGDITNPKSPSIISTKTFNNVPSDDCKMEKIAKEVEGENVDTSKNSREVEKSSSQSKKHQRYSAVIVAEALMDKFFGAGEKETEELSKLDSHVSSVHSKPSNTSTVTKNTSIQGSPPNQMRKPSNSKAQSSANKTKRFSFLGFYSSQPDSTSLLSIDSTSKKTKKKVLEPSNGANIVRDRAIPKKESTIGYTSFEPRKEPSTAKKVIDFFKRRSMRI
jgi:protein-serine/threonine kinase